MTDSLPEGLSTDKTCKPNYNFSSSSESDPCIVEPLPSETELKSLLEREFNDDRLGDGILVVSCVTDIRPVLQCRQPVCGLVGLTMASQILQRGIKDSALPLNLKDVAMANGYTKQGEVLSADHLLSIAQKGLCCSGHISSGLSLSMILQCLTNSEAILVPYDCDKDHTPCLLQGHNAHWCVIVGVAVTVSRGYSHVDTIIQTSSRYPENVWYYSLNTCDISVLQGASDFVDNVMVFARHGKSRHMGLWSLAKVVASNNNLEQLDPHRDPVHYVLPEGGLRESLAGKVVVLTR